MSAIMLLESRKWRGNGGAGGREREKGSGREGGREGGGERERRDHIFDSTTESHVSLVRRREVSYQTRSLFTLLIYLTPFNQQSPSHL